MRKFYLFITGFIFSLVVMKTQAQNDVANFTFTVSGNTVEFTNTSNTVPNDTASRRCYWQFGDGTSQLTFFSTSPHHVYPNSGTYQACLYLMRRVVPSTVNGDTLVLVSSICKTVSIVAPDSCRANFETTAASNTTLGRYFIAQPWHNNNKKPVYICWNFGDNHDTCIQYSTTFTGSYAVFHQYANAGNYNVCVRITYDGGCQSSYCKQVATGIPDSCSANFEALTTSSTLLGRYFVAQPWNSNNKKPLQICWNFGDNHDTCIQYATTYTGQYAVFHQYANVGSYNVCVKISYDGGCQSSYCKQVENGIHDSCSANFEVLTTNSTSLGRYFVAQPWNSNNKKPLQICWNFGDNHDTCIQYATTYTGQYAVSHQYANVGNYNVCVKISYDGGCQSSYCKQVAAGIPDSCSANFETLAVSSTPLGRYFVAQPWNNHNKKPVQVCWNFGDNHDTCIQYSTSYSGSYAVYHPYQHSGTYNVCVSILYDGGCSSRYCNNIQITGAPDSCSANFETLTTSPTAIGRYFVAQPWNSNNKKPLQICWNFGDNHDTCIQYTTAFTGQYAVFHQYANTGTYNVCVYIHYDGGCESHYCKDVQVGPLDSCKADFERITTTSTTPLTVALQAIPSNNHNKKPSRICWNFGDNNDTCITYTENYSGDYNIKHTYHEPGQYQVCVDILYFGGCEARECKQIGITLPPDTCRVQIFEATPSINSLTRGFYALPVSSNSRRVEKICWNFGDGRDTCINVPALTISPNLFISHNYPGPGEYRVCVKVYFAGGCIAENCITTVIRSGTDVCGGYFTDSLMGQRTFKFRAQSIHNPNDNVVSYRWSFGDGSTDTGQEITHTFSQGSNFQVCLIINTEQGCEARICKRIILPGVNTATLQLSPNPVINNLHVIFISNFTETVNIRIVNSYGTVVRSYMRSVTAGNNSWDFDLSTLISGVYSFTVQSPDQLVSSIFLKE